MVGYLRKELLAQAKRRKRVVLDGTSQKISRSGWYAEKSSALDNRGLFRILFVK